MVDAGPHPPTSLQELDPPTRALLALAVAVAVGEPAAVERGCRHCVAAAVPALWVDELFLQSLLMVGWPRTLSGLAVWRQIGGPPDPLAEPGTDYRRAEQWRLRGEAVCREVYGKQYERLRENVRALHPALESWMLIEGYGKTLGRAGLDLARRELCVAMQVAVQGAEPQLHAHLKGALNAGASPAAVSEALDLTRPVLGARELELAMALWERIRP